MRELTLRDASSFRQTTNSAVLWNLHPYTYHLQSGDALTPSKPELISRFLALPDEILLKIAQFLDDRTRNQDLRHLTLVCSRVRDIAQEVLVCTAVIAPEGIRGYLEKLLEHPERHQRHHKSSSFMRHTGQTIKTCFFTLRYSRAAIYTIYAEK